MDKTFDDYFSLDEIARALAAWRARVLPRRHVASARQELFAGVKSPEKEAPSDVAGYLPRRREWKRPGLARRRGLDGCEVATAAIVNAVRARQQAGTLGACEWGRRLLSLHAELRRRIAERDFSLSAPVLHLHPKDGGGYRCLASYADVVERLLLRGTARYLRRALDAGLLPCCHSFREGGRRNHRTAVAELADYRRRNGARRLYVAECDIRKFFDAVSHDEVRKALRDFVRRAEARGLRIDGRAVAVAMACLDSYATFRSFAAASRAGAVEAKGAEAALPAPSDLSPFYGDLAPEELPIGIPQGGALSPLIANLVLDLADRRVLAGADGELLYIRFCDDMVVAHPSREKCQAALDRYLEALRELRLPVHPVEKAPVYGRAFFEGKSKGPFAWERAAVGAVGASPWVSFLGCQIRFDGDVRIRRETIARHLGKLEKENGAFARLLQKALGKGGRIAFRKRSTVRSLLRACGRHVWRLVAKGVGCVGAERLPRDEGAPEASGRGTLCWTAAFPLAAGRSGALRQMRWIDAVRARLLNPFTVFLRGRGSRRHFLGRPFSYFGYMAGCARPAVASPGRAARPRPMRRDRDPIPDDVAYYREIG